MTRIATTYYGADPTTQFQWATSGSDQFSRIYDLYYLAQALEHHDHSNTRGLAVARVADGSLSASAYAALSVGTAALANNAVTNSKLADLSVSTGKLQDGSVSNPKYADNSISGAKIIPGTIGDTHHALTSISDNKLVNTPVHKAGDTMTGDLTITDSGVGSPTLGTLFFGNVGHRVGFDGTDVHADGFKIWTVGNDGTGSGLDADLLDGHDSSYFATAASVAAIVGVPSGIIAAVPTAAQIPSGWSRYSNGDGRFLIGAGTTFSQTFNENNNWGASNWTPVTGLGTDASGSSFLAASSASNNATGATSVSTAPHTHTVNGQGAVWIPPSRVVVWCQKS
jgi:hypothetical protein